MVQSKKILVPNDFSVRPLLLLKKIIESNPGQNYHIMLLHGIYPPDTISGMLYYSKVRFIKEMESEEFVKSRNLLKSKYQSRITAMYSEVITSDRRYALNTFLKVSGIEEIYLADGLKFKFSGENSFNIIPLLKKASVPVKVVPVESIFDEQGTSFEESSGLSLSGLTKALINPYDGRAAML